MKKPVFFQPLIWVAVLVANAGTAQASASGGKTANTSDQLGRYARLTDRDINSRCSGESSPAAIGACKESFINMRNTAKRYVEGLAAGSAAAATAEVKCGASPDQMKCLKALAEANTQAAGAQAELAKILREGKDNVVKPAKPQPGDPSVPVAKRAGKGIPVPGPLEAKPATAWEKDRKRFEELADSEITRLGTSSEKLSRNSTALRTNLGNLDSIAETGSSGASRNGSSAISPQLLGQAGNSILGVFQNQVPAAGGDSPAPQMPPLSAERPAEKVRDATKETAMVAPGAVVSALKEAEQKHEEEMPERAAPPEVPVSNWAAKENPGAGNFLSGDLGNDNLPSREGWAGVAGEAAQTSETAKLARVSEREIQQSLVSAEAAGSAVAQAGSKVSPLFKDEFSRLPEEKSEKETKEEGAADKEKSAESAKADAFLKRIESINARNGTEARGERSLASDRSITATGRPGGARRSLSQSDTQVTPDWDLFSRIHLAYQRSARTGRLIGPRQNF